MINQIAETTLSLWKTGRKTKSSQSGWVSGNAPCCVHNGESQDTRNRGGFIVSNGSISYSCFNCQFKASYQPGRHLTYKFRKLLSWLGADDNTVRRLVIDAVRLKDLVAPEQAQEPIEEIRFEARALPAEAREINELHAFFMLGNYQSVPAEYFAAVEYAAQRNLDIDKYKFYWTPEVANNLHRRLIVPFYYQKQIVGYTARAIVDGIKPKYYSSHPADFVFNLDTQQPDWKFVLVCEGPIDAMSVDGVAVSGAEISDQQAELIDRLQREVIVVPDSDRTGQRLIDRAIELGWTVSFPVWMETCKDINEAVLKYGKLFVVKAILESRETSKLKIELRKKRL